MRRKLKKTIFIIRHGQTDYNLQNRIQGRGIDAPLNSTGHWQSERLARHIDSTKLRCVHTSSLIRTQQTASPLITSAGLDLFPSRDLDEMDFGEFEGISYVEVSDELGELLSRWNRGEGEAAPKGGESPIQVFERADGAISRILHQSPDEHLLFILHGRLIRILLSQWLGLGYEGMSSIAHSNTSVNILEWEPMAQMSALPEPTLQDPAMQGRNAHKSMSQEQQWSSRSESLKGGVNGSHLSGRFTPVALNQIQHLTGSQREQAG